MSVAAVHERLTAEHDDAVVEVIDGTEGAAVSTAGQSTVTLWTFESRVTLVFASIANFHDDPLAAPTEVERTLPR